MPWKVKERGMSIKHKGKLLSYGDVVPADIVTEALKSRLKWEAPKQQPKKAQQPKQRPAAEKENK